MYRSLPLAAHDRQTASDRDTSTCSDPFSANCADTATDALLQHLLIDDLPVAEAVAQTAAEVGPDPVFEGELRILGG